MPDRDELRIQVQVDDPQMLLKALAHAHVSEEDRAALGRVATTHERDHVFIYADSREVAEHAAEGVRAAMTETGMKGELTIWRWHPLEERWEDASKPLPVDQREQEAEHRRLIDAQDTESRLAGYAEWEVRVALPTHHDAIELAGRLRREGIAVQRHWRYLLVGAPDEDQAQALATRIQREAPAGSDVHLEGVGMPIWETLNPYAIFGGLGN